MPPLIGIVAHRAEVALGELSPLHEVAGVAYVRAVQKAGGMPVLLPAGLADIPDLLERIDGLVLTGGGDIEPAIYGAELAPETSRIEPLRDARELELSRAAVERGMPVLAICRGCQVLNVSLGGTLVQHIEGHSDVARYNDVAHDVAIEANSELARWLGLLGVSDKLGVNTLHHQAVGEPGSDVRVVARAPDGTIEAIEVGSAMGVQWHPEWMRHVPEHLALFEWLVTQAL